MSLSHYDNWKLDSPAEYVPTEEYLIREEQIREEIEAAMDDFAYMPSEDDARRSGISREQYRALLAVTRDRHVSDTLDKEFNLC